MSIYGFDVPKVSVTVPNDAKLLPKGKRCAPAGIQQLRGGLGRSLSAPVLHGPKGWLKDNVRIHAQKSKEERERLHSRARFNPSLTSEGFFQAHQGAGLHNDVRSAGGQTQGAKIQRPLTTGYDSTKHGWYHPKGRPKQEQLREAQGYDVEKRSWGWDIRKSKDHIGYGDGTIGYGDVQESAISAKTPSWWVGVRMCDGPYGIPRFPACDIVDGKLCMNNRSFEKGPNLSIIEHEGERPTTGSSTPHFDDWKGTYLKHVRDDRRCLHSSLYCDRHPCKSHLAMDTLSQMVGAGCTVKRPFAPKSQFVGIDPKIPG